MSTRSLSDYFASLPNSAAPSHLLGLNGSTISRTDNGSGIIHAPSREAAIGRDVGTATMLICWSYYTAGPEVMIPYRVENGTASGVGQIALANGKRGVYDPHDLVFEWLALGARGSGAAGAADDTAAAKAARDLAYGASLRATVTGLSDPRNLATIKIGPGHYVINEAEALMTISSPPLKSSGFRIVGSGHASTVVEYAPTTPGGYLFNNERLLTIAFENVTFHSQNGANSFMRNNTTGGFTPQDFRFYDVQFTGNWDRHIKMEGSNNCSELIAVGLRVGGSVLCHIETNNDQNLNYNYEMCYFWPTATDVKSNIVTANLGGHFKFSKCDFSGINNADLFKLLNHTHARGACFFEMIGCRFELKNTKDIRVMQSQWPVGTVAFRDTDFSSQDSVYGDNIDFTSGGTTALAIGNFIIGGTSGATAFVANVVLLSGSWAAGDAVGYIRVTDVVGTWQSGEAILVGGVDRATTSSTINRTVAFDIEYNATSGPQYIFDGCSLIGNFRFAHGTDTFRSKTAVTFRNCDFQQREISDAFIFTTSTNDAGHPSIAIEGCRDSTGSTVGISSWHPSIAIEGCRDSTGSTVGISSWAATTAYTVGTVVRVGSLIYVCKVAGTSSSTAPSSLGSAPLYTVTDGTVTWQYLRAVGRLKVTDQTLNWRASAIPVMHRRLVRLNNGANATMPSAGAVAQMTLPPGAIIVRTHLVAAAGVYSSSNTTDIRIQTADETQTFSIVTTGALSAGYNNEWTGFYDVGSALGTRTIRCVTTAAVNQSPGNAYAFVEYIA